MTGTADTLGQLALVASGGSAGLTAVAGALVRHRRRRNPPPNLDGGVLGPGSTGDILDEQSATGLQRVTVRELYEPTGEALVALADGSERIVLAAALLNLKHPPPEPPKGAGAASRPICLDDCGRAVGSRYKQIVDQIDALIVVDEPGVPPRRPAPERDWK